MKKAYIYPTQRVVITETAGMLLEGSNGDNVPTSPTSADPNYGSSGDNSDVKGERGWASGW